MSRQACPECGRHLKPNARFCSYCGVSLVKRNEKPVSTPASPVPSITPQKTEPEMDVEPIPPAVEAALILRGKLETLRTQKIALDEEQETLEVKQLVGELSEDEAKKQIDKLQARLGPITKEIEELESKALTPLEQFQEEKKVQEGRLQRLEELRTSKEVEDAIYKRLSSEYRSNLSNIDQQLMTEISKANHWLVQLEDRKQQLEFDRETLQIRARIDEVSKSEVKKQLKTIDEEINKITSVIAGLRSLLGGAATPPKVPKTTTPSMPSRKKLGKKLKHEKCPYCQAKITLGSKYCYTCGRLLQS